MNVVYGRCCGIDIHKKMLVACILTSKGKEIKTFGTMTGELLELLDWIVSNGCEAVAMESTGVYWKPLYNLLEASEVKALVVNAGHIKAVPGRKTDVKDAEWIADLLRHGLLKASFIPGRDQRELRELVHYRRSLIHERVREVNRIQKVLEGANIKLASVVSDVMGASGRLMIKAMINGNEDTRDMSNLAKGVLRGKKDQLEKAIKGVVGNHQRFMLSTQLGHIEFLDSEISRMDEEIQDRMHPFEEELELLDTIPGVSRRTAEQILAEIGTDMSRFPTSGHLASWAGVSPGNNESAGKRKTGKTNKGDRFLCTTLVEVSLVIARMPKKNYLVAQYHRIAVRRGKKRAAIAVAHTILVIIYHMLKSRQPYRDLGADYFDKRQKDITVKNAVKRLESLGYIVNLEPVV